MTLQIWKDTNALACLLFLARKFSPKFYETVIFKKKSLKDFIRQNSIKNDIKDMI